MYDESHYVDLFAMCIILTRLRTCCDVYNNDASQCTHCDVYNNDTSECPHCDVYIIMTHLSVLIVMCV